MGKRLVRCTVAAIGAVASVGGGLLLAAPHAVAATSTQQITCGNTVYTIRITNNNSSQNGGWSVGQVVGGQPGLHGIPVSFSGEAIDTTTNMTLFQFSQVKGGGNANQNQQVTTCTQTLTGTVSQLFGPPPTGINGDDNAVFNLIVKVVIKP
jgi:hypothetical protein